MARVLVIEDNPENLELITYLLHAFGHQTAVAQDGDEGVAAARRGDVDLIICDVHLPKKDGYAIVAELKTDPTLRAIPLVAVTALAMVGDRDKLLAAGFDGYLSKPITPQEFVAQIEAFLPARERSARSAIDNTNPDTVRRGPAPSDTHPRVEVLVVDDSPINRELTRAILEPFGYRLTFASRVREARELATNTFDLIISDLHMPSEDGLSFLASVRNDAKLRDMPFMLISSSLGSALRISHDRERAMELGVTRFLVRPLEPQDLLDEVRRCLHERS